MSREWDALTAIKTYLTATMDATPEPALIAGQFEIGYPDEDGMKYGTMIYIGPEDGTWEPLTTQSLLETLSARVYIIIKPQARYDGTEAMIRALYEYFAALANAVVTDPTMGDVFDEAKILNFDFYPAVSGISKSVGLDISMQLQFERESLIFPGSGTYPSEDLHPIGG